MLETIFTLMMLLLIQAVLGFDNLLYISLVSKRAPEAEQARVRKIGIGLAVLLRIVMLVVVMKLVTFFDKPWFDVDFMGLAGQFNFHSIIILIGGVFIIYTAIKEIFHMMSMEEHDKVTDSKSQSAGVVIFWIVVMNLIFSFDSILSAMALSDSFKVMATAIVLGGFLMIWLADHVSNFLQKNRLYEVLGLFILFVVGIMLLTEGGHKAHMEIMGNPIEAMNKTTFYFIIAVLVLCDLVQSRYQRKLMAQKEQANEV